MLWFFVAHDIIHVSLTRMGAHPCSSEERDIGPFNDLKSKEPGDRVVYIYKIEKNIRSTTSWIFMTPIAIASMAISSDGHSQGW